MGKTMDFSSSAATPGFLVRFPNSLLRGGSRFPASTPEFAGASAPVADEVSLALF
jgi:hypothetical protein